MPDPKSGLAEQEHAGNPGELTIDLMTPAGAPTEGAGGGAAPGAGEGQPRLLLKPYQGEKRQDYVRMVVTVGLLSMLAVVVVWSCVEMMSYREHWENAKEMLQILLSPLTGCLEA